MKSVRREGVGEGEGEVREGRRSRAALTDVRRDGRKSFSKPYIFLIRYIHVDLFMGHEQIMW